MSRKQEREHGKFNVDIKIFDDDDRKLADIKKPLDKGIKEFDDLLKEKLNIRRKK